MLLKQKQKIIHLQIPDIRRFWGPIKRHEPPGASQSARQLFRIEKS